LNDYDGESNFVIPIFIASIVDLSPNVRKNRRVGYGTSGLKSMSEYGVNSKKTLPNRRVYLIA